LVHYRVVHGDTLEGIAERFDVTVAELKRWNNIRGTSVPRGSRLRIYAGGSPDESSRSKSKSAQTEPGHGAVQSIPVSNTEAAAEHQHRVQQGETLYSIAHAYKTTVDSLKEANPFLAERPIQPGDVLAIRR
jgi:membrane-bound lytic murein transglycosylase D